MKGEPIDRVIERLEAAFARQQEEIEIPRSSGRNYIQNYVDQLPRPSISSTHPEDHMCLICRAEYETDAEEGDDKDIAVQLPCGHILGSSCIAMWASSKLSVMCPFCTTPFLPPDLFGRVNDVRRYLFWMLRTYGYPVAGFLLHKMDSWNGEREPISHLQEFVDYTKSYNANGAVSLQVAMFSEALIKYKERKRGLEYQASPAYREIFNSKIARRAERDGMDIQAYVHASIMRVAAGCIMHKLDEEQLETVVPGFVDADFIDAYIKDVEYGPDGTCADYWLIPGLKLEHVGSIGHEKRVFPDDWLDCCHWKWNYPPNYYFAKMQR